MLAMILASSQISFRFIDVVVVEAGLKKNYASKKTRKVISNV
jgi:hypothetical protein